MTVWLSGSISESNTNIPNNTSDVTVNLYANWNSGSYANDNPAGYIIIDGTQYNFNSNFNVGQTSTGSQLIKTQSKTVTHNSDGSKTVACSASYNGTGYWDGQWHTVTWSDSKVLATIPRGSVIGTISAFNVEDSFSVPVTKYSESFTDTLEIKLGETVIKTITPYTNNAAITLTDAEILAAYNAQGADLTSAFIFKTSTYSGATLIGTDEKTANGTDAGTGYIKISGTWKRALPYIKVSGAWKKAIILFKNTTWKRGIN